MTESKIYILLSLVLIELVSGSVVSVVVPDPVISASTIAMLSNNPKIVADYANGTGWLAEAENANYYSHLTKTILQLFLLIISPIVTILVFVIRIL